MKTKRTRKQQLLAKSRLTEAERKELRILTDKSIARKIAAMQKIEPRIQSLVGTVVKPSDFTAPEIKRAAALSRILNMKLERGILYGYMGPRRGLYISFRKRGNGLLVPPDWSATKASKFMKHVDSHCN